MFINKCVSVLLSIVMIVDSPCVWTGPFYSKEVEITETVQEQLIEEVVEIPAEDVPEEIVEETDDSNSLPYSDSEIDLMALVTMGEAEGETEMGQRLVIDVILNRIDSPRFPNTVEGVIYAKNAFECTSNGRVNRCYVQDDIRRLVVEEIQNRTNSNIHYFRTRHYHRFGTPVLQVGNHYFSTY